ncbi:MAG TPA: D-aminoacylase [Flavitalea sp.]|nr:D-aminoacylase [Flavitalea sp.]
MNKPLQVLVPEEAFAESTLFPKNNMQLKFLLTIVITLVISCTTQKKYDLIIRNGMIYNGSGGNPFRGDIGINKDTIAFIGDLSDANSESVIDAAGLVVAPGFINMLSWATESLITDGNSQSDIRQGVTLEVMGEGDSMGPLNDSLRKMIVESQGVFKYPVQWTTLGEYLTYLEKKGISSNVASFIGATTVRMHVVGEDNRDPTESELVRMKLLVRQAMQEGAMGVGSSLIYPPAFFAKTNELIELCREAAHFNGMYISHIRSEGNRLYEALEELITISKEAGIRAEVYHLKAAGRNNWKKIDSVIRRIERARKEKLDITADMYNYTAGATGLTAAFPPSLQDGGFHKLRMRLQNRAIRARMSEMMKSNPAEWENLYYAAGGAENVRLLGFRQDSLKKFLGKTLAEVAAIRNKNPEETAMDLIVQDSSRIEVAYFLMNEENVRKQIALPWISFGSDAGSYANEGVFLDFNPHPRAYGNFSRLLGKYVREEKVIPLAEAIRKLTLLPATNLRVKKRGMLKEGYFADIVVFDSAAIADNATFDQPHRYASGMKDVLVNGVRVLSNGNHTTAKPGRFVKGPGFKGN